LQAIREVIKWLRMLETGRNNRFGEIFWGFSDTISNISEFRAVASLENMILSRHSTSNIFGVEIEKKHLHSPTASSVMCSKF
jgi:hypothetical protein